MVSIRILEFDSNRRGDLFNRLIGDLFIAMGYEEVRFNTSKAGREIDLEAKHRLKAERAIAEAKATSSPIGGNEINKFLGVLTRERKMYRETICGFFVSLSGFTSTARAQEGDGGAPEVVLLDGASVVSELITGNRLISGDRAAEAAGRCCGSQNNLVLDAATELLAHERGWIWALYYTQGRRRTHFALVHADGSPLARTIADEVVAADYSCGGNLHSLTCLNPLPTPTADADRLFTLAHEAYRSYLTDECGFVLLDGLPADRDVGARRLTLEDLFVPLHVELDPVAGEDSEDLVRKPVGAVLANYPRLALLASPGGGKSTLIKRLAVVYSDQARREQLADDLPRRDWFPLFFRCRELRGLARGSFADLVLVLSNREPIRQYSAAFRALVDRNLLDGRVLLLVDGLDEISDPGDRAAFVCTIRTALQAYPDTALVITSREAGFRHVAPHLAPICRQVTLSPFDANDIRRLCVAWQLEMATETGATRSNWEYLAETIVRNDRIMGLAVNPLLLTTLLVVKRWIGSLPTRRAILYGKAIEVLLQTWNTEGHAPIHEDEALPQLSYVAFEMTRDGMQKISRPRLAQLLQEARTALPIELGYVRDTVNQFIHRVEDRSSLLMMSGHDVEEGQLVEFFEFRHLAFQEFLAARAVVEGWHSGRRKKDTLATILAPRFKAEQWREVIPLAAVLGGKATEALLQSLIGKLRSQDRAGRTNESHLLTILGHCLADEAPAHPDTIRAAIRALVQMGKLEATSYFPMLAIGRYGGVLREEATKAYLAAASDLEDSGQLVSSVVWQQTPGTGDSSGYECAARDFAELLRSPEKAAKCEGALGFGLLCFTMLADEQKTHFLSCAAHLGTIFDLLVPILASGDSAEQYVACFALAWLSPLRTVVMPPGVLARLFSLWQHGQVAPVREKAGLALSRQPVVSRDQRSACLSRVECERLLTEDFFDRLSSVEKVAALILAWNSCPQWSDKNIADLALALLDENELLSDQLAGRTLSDLLSCIPEKDKQDTEGDYQVVTENQRRVPSRIVSESAAILDILAQIEQIAPTPATVLLLGESGTGKEVMAQAIHNLSPRHQRPMIRVSCAAIPAVLIEGELFGRERGAYTGALSRQIGRFEAANQSTLFLDEIGELPMEVQAKLVRVLQERVIERLGSSQSIKVDVRIIAATNRNLVDAVRDKTFREDLFYRLNVFPITVPPLRERVEDIPALVWSFIDEFSRSFGKTIESISKESMRELQRYPWPGNVRQLRNVIERAVIVATGPQLYVSVPRLGERPTFEPAMTLEVEHIRAVLESAKWRVRGPGGAAERLGLKPTTLESRMARLGITRKRIS